MNRKKVLIVIQLFRRGGVELAALNFALNLNPEKFEVSFLLLNPYENQDEDLKNEIINMNYNVIEMPRNMNSYIKKYKFISDVMAKGNYDAVHSHVLFFSGIVLMAAKKNNIKIRAAHSHAIKWNRKENLMLKAYSIVMRRIVNHFATHRFACSTEAGNFLYGRRQYSKKGIFIANGVDVEKFSFNKQSRKKIRDEFNIGENDVLVGHIGSIYFIKNQTFLVEVFSQMLKDNPNAKLILVGEEIEKDDVVKKAQSLGVEDKVIFAGRRSDICDILQGMDIMIFPSLHEAFPVSLIEAQAAQLPCLVSDTVTTEVKYNDNVEFMSLDTPCKLWADKASKMLCAERETVNTDKLRKAFDIKEVCSVLESFYSE